jgi:uncharacterized protein YkwD
MNGVDFVLGAIVVLAMFGGYARGFIVGTIELASWLVSLVAAFFLYEYVGLLLDQVFPWLGVWSFPLSFFLVIIFIRMIVGFIIGKMMEETPAHVHHSTFNKLLGAIPGFVNGVIYITIISALLLSLPVSEKISAEARESRLAGKLALQVEWLDEKLSPVFDEAINKTINRLTVEPGSTGSYNLGFTVHNAKVREDLEASMLKLVNEERAKVGLQALQPDAEMTAVARAHSQDMLAQGYFAHISKSNLTPAQRARQAGVKYLVMGENLAYGPTLQICHNGLMNSPGHKANILHKAYGRLGIGVLDAGRHGLMITQNFRN